MLIWIILLIGIFLFVLIIVYLKELLKILALRIIYIRKFILNRTGSFSISFDLIFLIEQLLLIIFVNLIKSTPNVVRIGVGVFALFVVFTANIQKFIWQYKYQNVEQLYENSQEALKYLDEVPKLIDEYRKLKKKESK